MKITASFCTFFLLLSFFSCKTDAKKEETAKTTQPPAAVIIPVAIPVFSPDSAYENIAKQVAFGPRVPNMPSHKACAAWLVDEFKRYGLVVIEQKFQAKGYTGEVYNGINIIAQYKPENPKRVLMAAHWDSRFHADKDSKDKDKPIDGADDGGSGVGVILELARLIQAHPMEMGVDFILFDAEDQGSDGADDNQNSYLTWCLGSQHWARNLHRKPYTPVYAILLDMVGAKNARFYKEEVSMKFARQTVEKVWNLAGSMGHGDLFVNQTAPGVTDDHYFVISYARIPMIDVISTPDLGQKRFGDYHHTHNDNMDIISKETLRKVGQTMTAFLYRVHNGTL